VWKKNVVHSEVEVAEVDTADVHQVEVAEDIVEALLLEEATAEDPALEVDIVVDHRQVVDTEILLHEVSRVDTADALSEVLRVDAVKVDTADVHQVEVAEDIVEALLLEEATEVDHHQVEATAGAHHDDTSHMTMIITRVDLLAEMRGVDIVVNNMKRTLVVLFFLL
jgi:hypothetical protein